MANIILGSVSLVACADVFRLLILILLIMYCILNFTGPDEVPL